MFCKHQWGLIHMEDVWQDNVLTYEGTVLHERVDNPEIKESRGNIFISRNVAVVSNKLRIQGVIDLIEFVKDESGIFIEEKNDYYLPTIIEYKRGKPKEGLEDKVQLCAQAIAFEEMQKCSLSFGYIYYFQTNRREKVYFDKELSSTVEKLTEEMNRFITIGETPKPEKTASCRNCSLTDVCSKNFSNRDARKYISKMLEDIE